MAHWVPVFDNKHRLQRLARGIFPHLARGRNVASDGGGQASGGRRVSPARQLGKLVTERAAAMGERVSQACGD
jgi:hypothetical protein